MTYNIVLQYMSMLVLVIRVETILIQLQNIYCSEHIQREGAGELKYYKVMYSRFIVHVQNSYQGSQ